MLKTSYKYLTRAEISYFMDLMVDELIDYYLAENIEFDISGDSKTILDALYDFVVAKTVELEAKADSELILAHHKQMLFYSKIMAAFVMFDDTALALKITNNNTRYNSLRNEILAVRTLLISNGQFK